jgi:hypothetical protein
MTYPGESLARVQRRGANARHAASSRETSGILLDGDEQAQYKKPDYTVRIPPEAIRSAGEGKQAER